MTNTDATRFNELIAHWCELAGHMRTRHEKVTFPASQREYRACGGFYLHESRYSITGLGSCALLVCGMHVWILRDESRPLHWKFEDMRPEIALAQFYLRMRPILEPVGDL